MCVVNNLFVFKKQWKQWKQNWTSPWMRCCRCQRFDGQQTRGCTRATVRNLISWLAENDVYETFASKDATMTISVFKQSRRILHEPDNWAFFLTAMKRMKALPRSLHVVSVLGFVRDTEDTDDVLALIEERPRDVCTLDTWLQRHAHISIRDIASLCRDIARGLAHLHAHLGAHKHLSPRSIQVHTHHHPEHQHYASASSSVPNTRVSAAVGDVHLAAGISCSVPSVPRYYDPDFDFGMRDDPRDFVWHAPENVWTHTLLHCRREIRRLLVGNAGVDTCYARGSVC